MKKSKGLIIGEEIFSSVTHGIGVLLGLSGLVILLSLAFKNHKAENIPAIIAFEGALIISFLFSTLLHSLSFTGAKKVFQILDHTSIFLLIAGTYTPFALLAMPPKTGWTLLLFIWGLAITGIILKAIRPAGKRKVFLFVYLAMGWLAVVTSGSLLPDFPLIGLQLLITGGLLYSAGTIFYLWQKLPFSHGVWHLFTIAGSFCHFLAVIYLIT